MKCEFQGIKSVFFEDLSIGQAFRYGNEMFLAIEPTYRSATGEVVNVVSLEDGRTAVFDLMDEVVPCKLNGYFEVANSGE